MTYLFITHRLRTKPSLFTLFLWRSSIGKSYLDFTMTQQILALMRNDVEQHTLSSYLGTSSMSLKHPFSNHDPVDFHPENRDKRSVRIHSSFLNVSLGVSRICQDLFPTFKSLTLGVSLLRKVSSERII